METNNNFSGGMNSDISKIFHSKDSYLQALNFRGVTTLGDSTGSLVNIKGNELNITLPEIKDLYKIIVAKTNTFGATLSGNATITVNGQTTTTLTIAGTTLGLDIYKVLKNLPNCYETTNATPTTAEFAVSYIDNYVVIYQAPEYTLPIVPPVNLTISIALSNPTTAEYSIYFESNLGVTSTSQQTYVTGATDLTIIGSSFIDEDIYLLASNSTDTESSPYPNDTFSNLGTIWKLQLDDITRTSTLKLIYANNLDFTRFHPVPPTAILGRYESKAIQRLYFTDFYNAIRTILVSDEQLMATNPALLSVFPSTTFELPLLNGFLSGSLPQGTYELAYRLKKSAGAVSNYSQPSNMIALNGNESDTSDAAFIGPNSYSEPKTDSGRGIQWHLNNVNSDWDNIQFYILYRATRTDVPVIYEMTERVIGNTFPLVINVTSLTGLATITFEEFIGISSGFTHAKTVETKDNYLFWGNVRSIKQKQLGDLFDARAFRAKTSGGDDVILINNNAPAFTYQATNPSGSYYAPDLPKDSDCINEYYDPTTGNISTNACYYQPGTNKLGGLGKFIKYEFGTTSFLSSDLGVTQGGDKLISNTVPFNKTQALGGVLSPIDLIDGTTDSDDQLYNINFPSIGGTKNPYLTSVEMSVQQEEIYRYGFQAFDLQGNPYYTEWIGDIKIPTYADYNDNPSIIAAAAGISDFRNSIFYGDAIYSQNVYIKFTVDVRPIAHLISAYQIVRVERTTEDKTILGHGMLTRPFQSDEPATADEYSWGGMWLETRNFPQSFTPFFTTGKPYDPYPDQNQIECLQGYGVYDMNTFDCFDFQTGGYSFKSGDRILIRSEVEAINREGANPTTTRYRTGFSNLGQWLSNPQTINSGIGYNAPHLDGTYLKYQTGYDSETSPIYMLFYVDRTTFPVNASQCTVTLEKGFNVTAGGEVQASDTGSYMFKNYMRTYGPDVDGSHPGQGAATVLLKGNFGKINAYNHKLMGLYYRPNVNQYGGNTYTARASNKYIACGSLIPIQRNNIPLINNKVITFNCFGGDIFNNYWDLQKIIKDIAGTEFKCYQYSATGSGVGNATGLTMSPQMRMSNMFFIPCGNTYNQAVRNGYHFDKNLVDDLQYYSAANDQYQYLDFNSNQKTVNKFIPKPINFIVNDEWRNRIYFSNVKIDNEVQDSWSVYPINQFYDVEGNYGGITSLIALNQNVYYIQEKGVGILMINPVSIVSDSADYNIKLGVGAVIQKHYYKAIDSGSKHQWSVNRSQGLITFTDVRQKKIFIFNGEQLTSVTDTKGQRNFINKRLHNIILNNDNPIIGKGILVTYDYLNNEFLYTFKNISTPTSDTQDENLTLVYSEVQGNFSSMFSFTPNIYINNNRYLFSVDNSVNKQQIYLHNYGQYGKFYNTLYPSTLKLLVNEHPTITKIFDNLTWLSDSIEDNIEWSDDKNIYPGSITNPLYPDDVNHRQDTFQNIRVYNDYQNSDWVPLTTTPPNNNLRRLERGFNLQVPRNKFDYDLYPSSTYSIFDPSKLTKTSFGERMRDKYLNIDLLYDNIKNLRFVIHNIQTLFRISDR